MKRIAIASLLFVVCALGATTTARAQRTIQYDTLSAESPAAISCGFCAGEKFGMVFRPLDSGGGLRPEEFPLTVNNVQIAVARAVVTGSILEGGYMCSGSSAGGTVPMTVEIYAGTTAPRGSINGFPRTGPWAGETMLFSQSADLTLSVESGGANMYDVMFTTVPVEAMAPAPNTYLRVVVSIPAGGDSSSCTELGLSAPSAVGIRDDDGRIENNIGFILAVDAFGGGIGGGWHWNESSEISDPSSGATGINGEWAIRLDIAPAAATSPDAGTSMPDAGTPGSDAGVLPTDDAGTSGPACTVDGDCAGGERCSDGMCVRVACAAASDCAGGMTCVEGMCRGLCTNNAECRGGEVCDMAAGYCVPVGTGESSDGCSCRAAGAGSRSSAAGSLLAFGVALAFIARRRAR